MEEVVIGPGGAMYEKGKTKRGAIERLRDYSEKNYSGTEIERVSASLATVVASRMESTLEDIPIKDKEKLAKYNNGFVRALLAIPHWSDDVLDILEENRHTGQEWFVRTKGLEKGEFDTWWDGMVAEAAAARLWKKMVGGKELVQDSDVDAQGLDFYDVISVQGKKLAVGLQIKSKADRYPDEVGIENIVVEMHGQGAHSFSADSEKYRRRMVNTMERLRDADGIELGVVLKITHGVKGSNGWRSLMRQAESDSMLSVFEEKISDELKPLFY